MTTFRIDKTKNYTVMSNNHFKEKRMSLKSKGLLSLMLSLPDGWNYTLAGLVSLSKDGKDSVMAALAELEKYGYLTRVRTTNSKGQFSGIEYNIFEEPQEQKPVEGKQNSDKQSAGKANSDKPPQLSNNNIKSSFNKISNISNTKEISPEMEVVLFNNVPNNSLRDLYRDYIEMREGIEAPLTPRGLQMLIQRNERLSNLNLDIQKILLETAIINNWKNIYSPNEDNVPKAVRENKALNELYKFYGRD